jgi:acyl-CoA reductase-like NAD-dependent aldehyde dehydrogenase
MNLATSEVVAEVARGDAQDVARAVTVARRRYVSSAWSDYIPQRE